MEAVTQKEFFIYPGKKIFVRQNTVVKYKTIRSIQIDETVRPAQYSLTFENTLAPMKLTPDNEFIITPEYQNNQLKSLTNDLEDISIIGSIMKFVSYTHRKKGTINQLGIIIKPKMVIKNEKLLSGVVMKGQFQTMELCINELRSNDFKYKFVHDGHEIWKDPTGKAVQLKCYTDESWSYIEIAA